MTLTAVKAPEMAVRRGMAGFEEFSEAIDFELEPFMRRIARAYFDPAKETVAILPRGNYKTTLAALIGLHHLLSVTGASVVIGASSRDQARICFERMQSFLAHPALVDLVTQRHLELRFEGPEGRRLLRVVPSDGPRTHGLSCSLYIADELWAWSARADLLTSMQTGLIKRADAKLLVISTASATSTRRSAGSAGGRCRSRTSGGLARSSWRETAICIGSNGRSATGASSTTSRRCCAATRPGRSGSVTFAGSGTR